MDEIFEIEEPKRGPERGILVGIERLEGLRRPDPAYCIGPGKLEELRAEVRRHDADVVIFNTNLTPTQHRNLVDALECKVIDRTELILDIFGQHAHTREGQLQVELARLTYELPRLVGRGRMMSRIGGGRRGGVGVRGPGEPQLATDRRHIEARIRRLRREIEEAKRRRDTARRGRRRGGLPMVSLVGYTNAGKSSLLNALVGAEVVSVDDQLFETLAPTVRRVELADGYHALVSDTVGFIQDLPHSLVAAFRATLEEVVQADLLVHVVDASDRYAINQVQAVAEVLEEIGADDRPIITALNKWDIAAGTKTAEELLRTFPEALPISARTGYNLDMLRRRMTEILSERLIPATARVPYHEMHLVQLVHERGRIFEEEYLADHVYIDAEVDREVLARLAPYLTSE